MGPFEQQIDTMFLESVPAFILRGARVDPVERSPDAEYILEGDEFDWQWFEVVLPIRLLNQNFSSLHPRAEPKHEQERFDNIRKWMQSRGGAAKAIHESPVLVAWGKSGKPALLDGWHRLKVATEEFGLKETTAIVGVIP